MSRRTKKRRAERRARQAREALHPPEPDTPVDWNRIAAQFRSLKGRAVKLGYIPYAPVEARDPEELEANVALELARLTEGTPVN